MTDEEKLIAKALAKCTFVPATPPKRFARDMAARADSACEKPLTEGQRTYLLDLLHRFRRQIPKTHAKLCLKCRTADDALPSAVEVGSGAEGTNT